MTARPGTGDDRREIIVPDHSGGPTHHAAAATFTLYVAANPPEAVVIVVAAGIDPGTAATAIEGLRAEYRGRLCTHDETATHPHISPRTRQDLPATSDGPQRPKIGKHRRHEPAKIRTWLQRNMHASPGTHRSTNNR